MFVKNLVTLLAAASAVAALPAPAQMASLTGMNKPNAIKNRYIVRFKETASADAMGAHKASIHNSIQLANSRIVARDGESAKTFRGIVHEYKHALKGYSGEFDSATLEEIRSKPEVAFVEVDGVKHTMEMVTQEDAEWGLARVSSKEAGGSTYTYDSVAGEGVTVYVIDTGIAVNHTEFEGRAKWGGNFAEDGKDTDGNGHGTHCAGTIGGKTYGVAKKVNLVAVKVLDENGSGSDSGVIAGVDFVAKEADKGKSVASMSLGGGASDSLDAACKKLIDAGVVLAVAAGNDNVDAGEGSPSRLPEAITVGASNKTDEAADFSNWGKVVDVYAPGYDVKSAWIGGADETNTISGTSMACPHVAGMAAYFLSLESGATVEAVVEKIKSSGIKDALKGVPEGTVNLLLNNGAGGSGNSTMSFRARL